MGRKGSSPPPLCAAALLVAADHDAGRHFLLHPACDRCALTLTHDERIRAAQDTVIRLQRLMQMWAHRHDHPQQHEVDEESRQGAAEMRGTGMRNAEAGR